MVRKAIENTCA